MDKDEINDGEGPCYNYPTEEIAQNQRKNWYDYSENLIGFGFIEPRVG